MKVLPIYVGLDYSDHYTSKALKITEYNVDKHDSIPANFFSVNVRDFSSP